MKKICKRVSCYIMTVLIVLSLFDSVKVQVLGEDAGEDNPSHWASESVVELKGSGLFQMEKFSGYQDYITREEFIYYAVRLYEILSGRSIEVDTSISFSDTVDLYAIKGASVGITDGIGGGKFGAKDTLTREQLATLIARILKDGKIDLQAFSGEVFSDDSEISSWAKESVYLAQANGILNGVGQNRFDPSGKATKEMTMVIVNRIMNNYDGSSWVDSLGKSHDIDIGSLVPVPQEISTVSNLGIDVTAYSLKTFMGANPQYEVGVTDENIYMVSSRGDSNLYVYSAKDHAWEQRQEVSQYGMNWPAIYSDSQESYFMSSNYLINSSSQVLLEIDFVDANIMLPSALLKNKDDYLMAFKPDYNAIDSKEYWGIYKYDSDNREVVKYDEGFDEPSVVYGIKESKDGRIWAVASSGVYYLTEDQWIRCAIEDYRSDENDLYQVPKDIEFKYKANGELDGFWVGINNYLIYYTLADKRAEITLSDYYEDSIGNITYNQEEGLLVLSRWWSGHYIYNESDFSKIFLHEDGSALDAAFIKNRLFLFCSDGYKGVKEVDLIHKQVGVFNEGLNDFSGLYTGSVVDNVFKGIGSNFRVVYDFDTQDVDVYSNIIIGESFDLIRSGDYYYIHDFDRGLWQLSKDLSEMHALDNQYTDWYGGSIFTFDPDGRGIWFYTIKNEQALMHYSLDENIVDYVSDLNLNAMYASEVDIIAFEGEGGKDILVLNSMVDWSGPSNMYVSYDDGASFELVLQDGTAKSIFAIGRKVYYVVENELHWYDVDTKNKGKINGFSTDGYSLRGIYGEYTILVNGNQVIIKSLVTGEEIFSYKMNDNSSFISSSFVDGAYQLLFSHDLLKIEF